MIQGIIASLQHTVLCSRLEMLPERSTKSEGGGRSVVTLTVTEALNMADRQASELVSTFTVCMFREKTTLRLPRLSSCDCVVGQQDELRD